jgi:predicted nucleotidyltransferase
MTTLPQIKQIIRHHRATLHDRYKVQKIGVFGSYSRGDTYSGSDLDILVEFYEPVSLLQLVSLENFLTDIVGIKVDVVPKEDIRVELKDRILREAIFV